MFTQYHTTISQSHLTTLLLNCQKSTLLFTLDTLWTFEQPGTLSEYLNSLTSRTAESRLPFPWESKSTWMRMVRHASEASSDQRCLRYGAWDDLLPSSFEHQVVSQSRSMARTKGRELTGDTQQRDTRRRRLGSRRANLRSLGQIGRLWMHP